MGNRLLCSGGDRLHCSVLSFFLSALYLLNEMQRLTWADSFVKWKRIIYNTEEIKVDIHWDINGDGAPNFCYLVYLFIYVHLFIVCVCGLGGDLQMADCNEWCFDEVCARRLHKDWLIAGVSVTLHPIEAQRLTTQWSTLFIHLSLSPYFSLITYSGLEKLKTI